MFPFTIDLSGMTGEMLLSVAGAAAACAVITQWLKQYLADWRWTNLLAFVITTALCEGAVVVFAEPTAQNFFNALIWALFGASLATFGYETVLNLLGMAGVGPRKG